MANKVTRADMTRPRVRLRAGEDPTSKLRSIYASEQLDRPKGAVRISRDGVMTGEPRGFTGTTDEHQRNQFPENKHGKSYDEDVKGWQHNGGDRRPAFDRRGHTFRHADNNLRATGRDATKSPFSAANFKGRGERK